MSKQRYERPVIKKLETGMPNKFGTRTEYQPMTNIDGVPVTKLMKEYGSPLFVISEKIIRSTIQKAKKAFRTRYPRVQFAWSYKTNYLNSICSIFHQEGSWAEVVSGFEYDKAISLGVDGKKIIFNGPEKSEEDLTKAIKNDSLIHIDHLDELYTISELAEKFKIRPRVASGLTWIPVYILYGIVSDSTMRTARPGMRLIRSCIRNGWNWWGFIVISARSCLRPRLMELLLQNLLN
ncbi:MAG: hypothetical protein NTX43_11730 [Bacteroidetes bacterium]|nr:hypothetical protein [Bacteroidota bacterium]